jgi:hypothetical protein
LWKKKSPPDGVGTISITRAIGLLQALADGTNILRNCLQHFVVWRIRRYILHEQQRPRGRGRNPAETEAQIISLLRTNENYKAIAATARCSITTIVRVARASGLSRRGRYKSADGDRAI